jgi:hypothetical protein
MGTEKNLLPWKKWFQMILALDLMSTIAMKILGTPPVSRLGLQGQFPVWPSRLPMAPVDDDAACRLRQLVYELDLVLEPA